MNQLVVFDAILAQLLDSTVADIWGFHPGMGVVFCGLYTSNHAPNKTTDTLATFTAIEATFPGYGQRDVTAIWAWSSAVVVTNQAITVGPTLTWIRSPGAGAPETVYGYFLYHDTVNRMMWAQLFDTPQVIQNPGDSIVFTLQYTRRSQA